MIKLPKKQGNLKFPTKPSSASSASSTTSNPLDEDEPEEATL
jgi:hypothetical protein